MYVQVQIHLFIWFVVALVEVLWLLCIVYVIRAQPAEPPR